MTLYTIAGKSFADLMKKDGYSRTFISRHVHEYHWLFTKLVHLTLRDTRHMVRLNVAPLDKVLKTVKYRGAPMRLSKLILDDFVKWSIIIREWTSTSGDAKHQTRVRFRFTAEMREAGFDDIDLPSWSKLPNAAAEIAQKKPLVGIYHRLATNLSVVTIDAAAARQYAQQAYDERRALPDKRSGNVMVKNRRVNRFVFQSWMRTIADIEKREMYVHANEDGTGRFYSTIASCPKCLRQFLRINGKPLVEVDIANCQPLLFAVLLKQHHGTQLPKDVASFIAHCEGGTIYQVVRDLVLTPEESTAITKSTFKAEFFARVFFSTEKVTYQWRARFEAKDAFPNVSAFIKLLKAEDYKELPKHLTNLEAELLLHGVAQQLLDQGVTEFVTVHDAIYTTSEHLPLVKQLVKVQFQAQGVAVTIKEEKGQEVTIEEKLAQSRSRLCGDGGRDLLARLRIARNPRAPR